MSDRGLPSDLARKADAVYGWVGPGYPELDDKGERDVFMEDVIAFAYHWYHWRCSRGPEPKAKASKQELIAALVEIRDRCGRVAEARAVARRVLGK